MKRFLCSLAMACALYSNPPDGPESEMLPGWARERALVVGVPADCGKASREWKHRIAGLEITVRPMKDISVQGRDRRGMDWRVLSNYPGDGGCRLVSFDLDRNGFSDLIFLTANAGSGPAGVTMTVLAFDAEGRPVPWQATGPFVLEDNRILNLVDLNADGRAELLLPFMAEYGLRGETATHTSLYLIADGYFRRANGTFAGRKFPVEVPSGIVFAEEPDLTNVRPADEAETIGAVRPGRRAPCWLDGITLVDGAIALAPNSPSARDCEGNLRLERTGRRTAIPLILVVDSPTLGRVIHIDHSIVDELRKVIGLHLRAAFIGRSCETGCRPMIMWVRRQ